MIAEVQAENEKFAKELEFYKKEKLVKTIFDQF
jgi:hypothetical protein